MILNTNSGRNSKLICISAIAILLFSIPGCLTTGFAMNRNQMPGILSNNYEKPLNVDTQALMWVQGGLKITECDNQATANSYNGEPWGRLNNSNIQFVAVLSPGRHVS